MQALVFGFTDLELPLASTCEDKRFISHVLCAEHCLQRVSVICYDLSSVDQAHALRSWFGGHRVLDLEPELSDGCRCGELLQVDAALDLAGRR